MSSVDRYVPSWLPIAGPKRFVGKDGREPLFSANVLGTEPAEYRSNIGANFGFVLRWASPVDEREVNDRWH